MSLGWTKSVLAAVAVLTLGSAVQASERNVAVRVADHHAYGPVADFDTYDESRFTRHERGDVEERFGRRHPDRFYGRPVPDQPRWARPVFDQPRWRHRHFEECRVIVKRRVNFWGEPVVRRIRICD